MPTCCFGRLHHLPSGIVSLSNAAYLIAEGVVSGIFPICVCPRGGVLIWECDVLPGATIDAEGSISGAYM